MLRGSLVGMVLVSGLLWAFADPPAARADHPHLHRHVAGALHAGRAEHEARVARVAGRVLAAAAPFCDVPARCLPEFRILDGARVNAYAEPGLVTVSRGMIDLARSDDELALVLGHEVAHLLLGHGAHGPMALEPGAAHAEEFEADHFGLYLVARAGYAPRAAIELWPNLAAALPQLVGGGAAHPGLVERHQALLAISNGIEAKRRAGLPLIP